MSSAAASSWRRQPLLAHALLLVQWGRPAEAAAQLEALVFPLRLLRASPIADL